MSWSFLSREGMYSRSCRKTDSRQRSQFRPALGEVFVPMVAAFSKDSWETPLCIETTGM